MYYEDCEEHEQKGKWIVDSRIDEFELQSRWVRTKWTNNYRYFPQKGTNFYFIPSNQVEH